MCGTLYAASGQTNEDADCMLSDDDQPQKIEMRMFEKIQNPREIRLRLNLNQQEFWGQIGVTQSGGSPFENGRHMTKPVRGHLPLGPVEPIDLKQNHKSDVAPDSFLEMKQPAPLRRPQIASHNTAAR